MKQCIWEFSIPTAVQENTAKAQRTLFSLMASGIHGENGLNPETCAHLLQIYVLSVLVYGLEVILPKPTLVEKLSNVYNVYVIIKYCSRLCGVYPCWCTSSRRGYSKEGIDFVW